MTSKKLINDTSITIITIDVYTFKTVFGAKENPFEAEVYINVELAKHNVAEYKTNLTRRNVPLRYTRYPIIYLANFVTYQLSHFFIFSKIFYIIFGKFT